MRIQKKQTLFHIPRQLIVKRTSQMEFPLSPKYGSVSSIQSKKMLNFTLKYIDNKSRKLVLL